MAEYSGMTPTVVIGLGGTGKEVLIKIRRMIVETYGSLDHLPIVSFLHIDTEQNAKVSEPQTVLGQDISLRPVEQVWAKVENAKAILNNLSSFEYLEEWFPNQLKGTDSIVAGAGQIRALGKLAFTVNYPQIKNSFENAKQKIIGHEKYMLDERKIPLDKGINIFVVCSLSGGTGSGMFLDIAYNLRDWVPPSDLPQTSAYLILPGAFSGLGDRVIANAYAALMELNHFSQRETRFEAQYSNNTSDQISIQSGKDEPFSFCYLVGNSNDKVTLPTLESVLEMVAENIFLDFTSGFSQYKKLVRDNIRKQWSEADFLGYTQNFITFGLSSIQFPVERVLNACASRLASRVVSWWANPNTVSTAMQDVIKTEILPSLQLAESQTEHQILNSISLSENNKSYIREVAEWINEIQSRRNELKVKPEALPNFINTNYQRYDPHFNDTDPDPKKWSDYFKRMWENLNELISKKPGELRELVYDMAKDRSKGATYIRKFLEDLREIFLDYGRQFDQERSKNWLKRFQDAETKLPVLLKQIEDDTNNNLIRLFNQNRIEEDFNKILQTLESLYISKVEVKSRALAVQLINNLIKEIDQLLADINVYGLVLGDLRAKLKEREESYTQETNRLTVNGILLYNPKVIDQVYNQALPNQKEQSVRQTISQKVLNELNLKLFDLYTFDELRKQDLYNRLWKLGLDEFESKQLPISAAKQFIEEYPTLYQQEAQIKTTFEKSEPFLRFSQEQKKLNWDERPEKRQTLVGIAGGSKPSDAAGSTILPLIRKASTLTDKDIRPLNKPYQIYFVQEIGAFPLRLIEGMDRMRTVYRALSLSDKNPLHTHRKSRIFQDHMPAPQSEMQVRHNFILGRIFGLLKEEQNRATGYKEIRFTYLDKQAGFTKNQPLGQNWQEAEEYFLSDNNRKLREILAEDVQKKGKEATTKSEKQVLYQTLVEYKNQLARNLEYGEDDPEYKKVEEAVGQYIKNYSLFVEPVETKSPLSKATALQGNSINSFNASLPNWLPKLLPVLAQLIPSVLGIPPTGAETLIALIVQKFVENGIESDMEIQNQMSKIQTESSLTDEQITKLQGLLPTIKELFRPYLEGNQ